MARRAPAPSLRWRPYRDPITNVVVDARRVSELYDEDVAVGQVRFLADGSSSEEPGKLRVWAWSVYPSPGPWGRSGLATRGSERSKTQAKASAEAAYRRIRDIHLVIEVPGSTSDGGLIAAGDRPARS